MNNPRVTIGIPVRNGESEIEGCLDCLTKQTYRDISILVYDNASTDRTQEIVAAAMLKDSRISYFRHDQNIGALPNFAAVLAAATTPYFMWRAYDDLSNETYVESLVAALDAQPDALLAAPRTETLRTHSGRLRVRPAPNHASSPQDPHAAERWMLRRLKAGWFYGLYQREFLVDTMEFVAHEYSFVWAWDFLILATTVFHGKIMGVPQATFIHRLTGAPKQYSSSETHTERIALARNYWQVIEKLLAKKNLSTTQRLLYRLTFVIHIRRRVAKWPILLRAVLTSLFRQSGVTPHA